MLRKTIVSCAALVSLAGAVPANADVIKVPCRGGAGGLVRAIKLANSTTRADTIKLAPGCRYVLTKVDNNWYGPNGLPAISSAVTIKARGAVIARSRAHGTPPFRLFFVGADPADPDTSGYTSPGPGRLTLRDVTLTGGLARGGNSASGGAGAGFGGAIFNQGEVRLVRSTLAGNVARGGTSFYPSVFAPYGDGGGGLGGGPGPPPPGTGGGLGGGKPPPGGGRAGGPRGGHPPHPAGGGGGGGGFGAGGGRGAPGSGSSPAGKGGAGGFGGGGGGRFPGSGATETPGGVGGGSGGIGDQFLLGGGGAGMGGAVFTMQGKLSIVNSTLSPNSASGGRGNLDGLGAGGAVPPPDRLLTTGSSTPPLHLPPASRW